MTPWHRILARYPEGTTEYEFAKRVLFFKRRQALLFQELNGSPRSEVTPKQKVDRFYDLKQFMRFLIENLHPRNLKP